MSNDRKNDDYQSNFGLFAIAALGITALISQNIQKIEKWFFDHWFILTLIVIGLSVLVKKIFDYRYKMKHPDLYARQLALKEMEMRRNSDFSNKG